MDNPIKTIRHRHALSRKELAQLAGVPYNGVYRTEAGLVQHPHARIVQALADLGYDPEVIRGEYAKYVGELRERAVAKARGTTDGSPWPPEN